MKLLNRYVVTVRPAQPMIDWVRQVDIDTDRRPVDEDTIRNTTNAYLVPDLDPPERAKNYFMERANEIFEEQLWGWFTEPDFWPENRDLLTFLEWFDLELHEMTFDLAGTPLEGSEWP
jgi:hypothetical protein